MSPELLVISTTYKTRVAPKNLVRTFGNLYWTVIRSKILLAFERAEAMASTPQALEEVPAEEIRRLLTFALVGAGTVGVEMASTLAEMSRMAAEETDSDRR